MKRVVQLAAALLLTLALASPALAAAPSEDVTADQFAALKGVDAEALVAAEMDQIHGEFSVSALYQALLDKAALIRFPRLREAVLAYLVNNKDAIIAYLMTLPGAEP